MAPSIVQLIYIDGLLEKTAELAENVLIPPYAYSTKTEIGKMSKSHQKLTESRAIIDVKAA